MPEKKNETKNSYMLKTIIASILAVLLIMSAFYGLIIAPQVYPMSDGRVMENEVKNMNDKLSKMDGNIEKILDKLNE